MKKLEASIKILITIIISVMSIFIVTRSISALIHKEVYPTVYGYGAAIVNSGSMKPNIKVNDVVVTKQVESYKKNDIVLYQLDNVLVTHRIIAQENGLYLTKGDANNKEDNWIKKSQIKGRLIFKIPKIGIIQEYFSNSILLLLIIIILCIPTKKRLVNKNESY